MVNEIPLDVRDVRVILLALKKQKTSLDFLLLKIKDPVKDIDVKWDIEHIELLIEQFKNYQ